MGKFEANGQLTIKSRRIIDSRVLSRQQNHTYHCGQGTSTAGLHSKTPSSADKPQHLFAIEGKNSTVKLARNLALAKLPNSNAEKSKSFFPFSCCLDIHRRGMIVRLQMDSERLRCPSESAGNRRFMP